MREKTKVFDRLKLDRIRGDGRTLYKGKRGEYQFDLGGSSNVIFDRDAMTGRFEKDGKFFTFKKTGRHEITILEQRH